MPIFINYRKSAHIKCSTKTIYHEVSKRGFSGKNKWLHPDIVAVHFHFESYTGDTLKLFDVLKVNPYKLYSFGIGIIRLDVEHIMQSEIIFSAKEKDRLDWDTINRLANENIDFHNFLKDLIEDIKIGKVKSKYDDIYEDEKDVCEYALRKRII